MTIDCSLRGDSLPVLDVTFLLKNSHGIEKVPFTLLPPSFSPAVGGLWWGGAGLIFLSPSDLMTLCLKTNFFSL